jgi:hypothetical protein
MRAALVLGIAAALSWLLSQPPPPAQRNDGLDNLPVLFEANFEASQELGQWDFTDAQAWRVGGEAVQDKRNHFLSLFRQSDYKPPVRSPVNIALIRDVVVSDFVLEVKARSTTQNYPHRDVCLFFGYQDPGHYYYVHIGKEADATAHSVFLVNGQPRVSIAQWRSSGFPWDETWHTLRVERTVQDGRIAVFVDDRPEPIMTARDQTFPWGRVGVGSFDDTADFDDLRLRGVQVKPGTGP